METSFTTIIHQLQKTVTETSIQLGKRVELVLSGEETFTHALPFAEITDILRHLIRNGIDHGIESPADRKRMGKDPIGKITIRFRLENGNFLIEVNDDGVGINSEQLYQLAQSHGIVSEAPISEEAKIQLIFYPGLTTKKEVSTISGRGIGMDIVKTHIQDLSGKISVTYSAGQGTTFSVSIPVRGKTKKAA